MRLALSFLFFWAFWIPSFQASANASESSDRIRSALDVLSRTESGARAVRKLQLKMKKNSVAEMMSAFRWGNVSRTDAVLTRHYDPSTGVETREREVTVYLKRGAPIQDLLLDLAHEMTHAASPSQWDPYDPDLTVIAYIHQALEAPGGEVDALFAECEVALELKDISQGLGLSVDRCSRYLNAEGLSREQIQRDFYRVGNWKSKVLNGLSRLGAHADDLPFLSADSPRLYSSTGQAPYPLALIREFEDLNRAACENTRRRVDAARSQVTSPQVDRFLNKRCRVTQAASLYAQGDAQGEPDTQVPLHKQANYYRRANDVISTDTIYYIRKVELLGSASDEKIKTELQGFCIAKEPYETKTISHEQACLKRLKFVAAEHIQKNKLALGKNENSIAELSSSSTLTPVARNTLHGEAGAAGDEESAQALKPGFSKIRLEKKADNPELLSVEEIIENNRRENERLRALASPEYQAAIQRLPAPPSKEDFTRFKEVLKDPTDPKSEKIQVLDKDHPYDEGAFENARREYETQRVSAIAKQFDLQDRTQATTANKPEPLASPGALSVRAYEEARGSVIQALTKKEGQGKVSVPDSTSAGAAKNRTPSATPQPSQPDPVVADDPYWGPAREMGQKTKAIPRDAKGKKTEIRVTIDPALIDQEVKDDWKAEVDEKEPPKADVKADAKGGVKTNVKANVKP